MKKVVLHPCPFCGNGEVRICRLVSSNDYVVECGNCKSRSGRYNLPEKAQAAWNHRRD
jgi:transcription elongation factor Elf1